VQKVEHYAALPYREIAEFIAKLREQKGVAAQALEFLILTAARTGEVIGARWEEFDLKEPIWTVPAKRMKASREHRVPLSDRAIAIVQGMAEARVGDFIFPGGKPTNPLSNMAMLKLLQRMERADLTAHGFRSTFRDWAAEQTSYPHEVAEMALAHTVGDKVEAAYRRGDLFEKRHHLMADWDRYCGDNRGPSSFDNAELKGLLGSPVAVFLDTAEPWPMIYDFFTDCVDVGARIAVI